ncbi:unnamed protein product [Symbiodinium sp. CCMP2592]|nr:unnamed protein product [Symbiodinium sp. CCMP2592]
MSSTAPLEAYWSTFTGFMRHAQACVDITTFFIAVDPVFNAVLHYQKEMQAQGILFQGPNHHMLAQTCASNGVHPMCRVMYTGPKGKIAFNPKRPSPSLPSKNSAVVGQITNLSQLKLLAACGADVIAVDMREVPKDLEEYVKGNMPGYQLAFVQQYCYHNLGVPLGAESHILAFSRHVSKQGREGLVQLMSLKVQCMDFGQHGPSKEWMVRATCTAGETVDPGAKNKRTFSELVAKACESRWLPSDLHAESVRGKMQKLLQHVESEASDLLKVHLAILKNQSKKQKWENHVLAADASSLRFSHHRVYVEELPPIKAKTVVLTYQPEPPKGRPKANIVSHHELLNAHGYPSGTVHVQMLGQQGAGVAMSSVVPAAVGLFLCAAAVLLQPQAAAS